VDERTTPVFGSKDETAQEAITSVMTAGMMDKDFRFSIGDSSLKIVSLTSREMRSAQQMPRH
jgi:hypothetical protein